MKIQIDSILIPMDFSNLSERALKVGVAVAIRQKAEIILLHVIDKYNYIEQNGVFSTDFKVDPYIINALEDRLNELSNKISEDTGIKVTKEVIVGQPADNICLYAFEKKTSLIVIGTDESSGLQEFFIDSEPFRVVKNAVCPVLTIPANWEKNDFEKVLLPIRIKPGQLDKYIYSSPIIEKNNSELFLLGLSQKKNPGELKELATILDLIRVKLHNDNVKFHSTFSPCEDFAAKVIEISKSIDADLIVLTTNLDYDFKSDFVGPFAQQIIQQSNLPVLSIKPAVKVSTHEIEFENSEIR
jgi:nucleotide-binding universal stress UspA family protein